MKIEEEIEQNKLLYKGCIIDDSCTTLDYKRIDITKCKCSQDGQYLAWSNSEGIVKILNLNKQVSMEKHNDFDLHTRECSKEALKSIACPEQVTAIAFGTSKTSYKYKHHLSIRTSTVNKRFNLEGLTLLAVGLQSGKIYIYNTNNWLFLFALCDHRDTIRDLKFTNEGSFQLASASKDCAVKLWDMFDDGNMYRTLSQHSSYVNSVDWSPTAPLLCSVGSNREAYVWSTSNYTVRHALRGHMHDVVSCEFSCDGGLLATASYDTRIAIWDPYTGELLRSFYHILPPPRAIFASGHNDHFVKQLSFSKNGSYLVSICDDKKLRSWQMESRSLQPYAELTDNKFLCCTYSTDERVVMVGCRSSQINVYTSITSVSSLMDICRKYLNKLVSRNEIDKLQLPKDLEKYLKYGDVKRTSGASSPTTQAKSPANRNAMLNDFFYAKSPFSNGSQMNSEVMSP